MSFFNDLLDSIGSDKAPAPPKPLKRPVSTNSDPSSIDMSKAVSKLGINGTSTVQNGIKRKAEDDVRRQVEKSIKSTPTSVPTTTVKAAQPMHSANGSKTSVAKTLNAGSPSSASQLTAKPPPKGSFADIMARAKQAQEQRGQNQVGVIKHQAVSKEKVSKLSARKREDEEKAKALKSKLGPRSGGNGRIEKRRSASPVKKQDQLGIPKPARPPINAPSSGYKGTMGITSQRRRVQGASTGSRDRSQKKRSRFDEYLGTDEEDNSDVVEDDDGEMDGYDSHGSSDMEVGAFELDEEESLALKAAKQDDAKEAALENQHKKEKEERRRRLQAMADKRK